MRDRYVNLGKVEVSNTGREVLYLDIIDCESVIEKAKLTYDEFGNLELLYENGEKVLSFDPPELRSLPLNHINIGVIIKLFCIIVNAAVAELSAVLECEIDQNSLRTTYAKERFVYGLVKYLIEHKLNEPP